LTVAEGAGNTDQDAHDLVDADRKELNMAYPFEWVDIAKSKGYDLVKLKTSLTKWDSTFATKGWMSIFLANHDQARMVTRFASDKPEFRDFSAKMLNTFLFSMRGTPYAYYGDELGMINIRFDKIEDYNDMPTLNEYQHLKQIKGNIPKFLEEIKFSCRDNGRTPFQWDNSTNAGFTTGKPWLKVHPNYVTLNASAQENDPNSVLNYFRKMVQLRKNDLTLVYGKYTLLDSKNPNTYCYTRELNGKKLLVMLNFKTTVSKSNTGIDVSKAKILIGNYPNPSNDGTLKPCEAVIYQL
jgi:oligo-1,6-glucosidase